MAKNEIAKRNNPPPAVSVTQTDTGYEQMVVQTERPDKTLIHRMNTGLWKLDVHFYNVPESSQNDNGQWNKTSVYRPTIEGKLMIGALAGCRHETNIIEASPDYVKAEAVVFYKDPTGEVIKFRREKEVSIELERLAAKTKKINSILFSMKKQNGGNPARYKEISEKAMDIEDDVKRQKYLERELLDILDIQTIQDNMIKLRQTLANMAMSKALSSAYTEWLRYIGQRLVFKGEQNGDIPVSIINTIEIPKQIPGRKAVNLLYAETIEDEATETEELLKAEDEPTNTAVMVEGIAVDPSSGECLTEQEILPADSPDGELSDDDLIKAIKVMCMEQKMSNQEVTAMLEFHVEQTKIADCDSDDLFKIYNVLRSPKE